MVLALLRDNHFESLLHSHALVVHGPGHDQRHGAVDTSIAYHKHRLVSQPVHQREKASHNVFKRKRVSAFCGYVGFANILKW